MAKCPAGWVPHLGLMVPTGAGGFPLPQPWDSSTLVNTQYYLAVRNHVLLRAAQARPAFLAPEHAVLGIPPKHHTFVLGVWWFLHSNGVINVAWALSQPLRCVPSSAAKAIAIPAAAGAAGHVTAALLSAWGWPVQRTVPAAPEAAVDPALLLCSGGSNSSAALLPVPAPDAQAVTTPSSSLLAPLGHDASLVGALVLAVHAWYACEALCRDVATAVHASKTSLLRTVEVVLDTALSRPPMAVVLQGGAYNRKSVAAVLRAEPKLPSLADSLEGTPEDRKPDEDVLAHLWNIVVRAFEGDRALLDVLSAAVRGQLALAAELPTLDRERWLALQRASLTDYSALQLSSTLFVPKHYRYLRSWLWYLVDQAVQEERLAALRDACCLRGLRRLHAAADVGTDVVPSESDVGAIGRQFSAVASRLGEVEEQRVVARLMDWLRPAQHDNSHWLDRMPALWHGMHALPPTTVAQPDALTKFAQAVTLPPGTNSRRWLQHPRVYAGMLASLPSTPGFAAALKGASAGALVLQGRQPVSRSCTAWRAVDASSKWELQLVAGDASARDAADAMWCASFTGVDASQVAKLEPPAPAPAVARYVPDDELRAAVVDGHAEQLFASRAVPAVAAAKSWHLPPGSPGLWLHWAPQQACLSVLVQAGSAAAAATAARAVVVDALGMADEEQASLGCTASPVLVPAAPTLGVEPAYGAPGSLRGYWGRQIAAANLQQDHVAECVLRAAQVATQLQHALLDDLAVSSMLWYKYAVQASAAALLYEAADAASAGEGKQDMALPASDKPATQPPATTTTTVEPVLTAQA